MRSWCSSRRNQWYIALTACYVLEPEQRERRQNWTNLRQRKSGQDSIQTGRTDDEQRQDADERRIHTRDDWEIDSGEGDHD